MSFFRFLFGSASSYDIDKIKVGFSKDQVRSIFGEPHSVRKGSNTSDEWVFTIPFRLYVSIDFDAAGKVSKTYSSGER